jgi:hypothetical protein
MSAEKSPIIPREEALSPEGCGAGTENACFALSQNGDGEMECLLISNPQAANMAGIKLGWRLNIDPSDEKPWCPTGVLEDSKTPAEQ